MILWPRTTYNPGHRSSSQTSPSPRWHTRWSSPPTWASHRSSHCFTSSHAGSQWKCPPSVRASCTHFFTFSNEKTTYKNCQTASPHISININEYISQLSFILIHKSGFLHLHSHYNTIILIPSHMGKYLKPSHNFLQTAAVMKTWCNSITGNNIYFTFYPWCTGLLRSWSAPPPRLNILHLPLRSTTTLELQ